MSGAGLYIKRGGVLTPTATVPGPKGMDGIGSDADFATILADGMSASRAELNAAFGKPVSTDGTDGLPEPTGVGLEFVITATGLDDIRYEGASL